MHVSSMMLCKNATADGNGLLTISGGALSRFNASTLEQVTLVVVIDLPWDLANQRVTFYAQAIDTDGNPRGTTGGFIRDPDRPQGWLEGAPVPGTLLINASVGALPVGRYTWHLLDQNKTPIDGAYVGFAVD